MAGDIKIEHSGAINYATIILNASLTPEAYAKKGQIGGGGGIHDRGLL